MNKKHIYTFFLLGLLAISCNDDDTFTNDSVVQFNSDLSIIDTYLANEEISAEIDFGSGVRYSIEQQGTGLQPYFADSLRINIQGSVLTTGVEFINEQNRIFATNELPAGSLISTSYIQEGGTVKAFIPSFFGFGETGQGVVPPNSVLITSIELLEVYNFLLDDEIMRIDSFALANDLDLLSHPTGIRYSIQQGSGSKPTLGDAVSINYSGEILGSNEVFDNGRRVTFDLDGLIQGWQVMLPELQEGGVMTIYLPSQFGYGAQGFGDSIPPNSILVFDITLIQVL